MNIFFIISKCFLSSKSNIYLALSSSLSLSDCCCFCCCILLLSLSLKILYNAAAVNGFFSEIQHRYLNRDSHHIFYYMYSDDLDIFQSQIACTSVDNFSHYHHPFVEFVLGLFYQKMSMYQ